MITPKTRIILPTLICAFISMNASDMRAQFNGSFTVSVYRSTNVEGRDSATPDNVFNPSIDLLYNWDISNPTSIRFEATVTPNLYQVVPARSYLKSFLSATGSFYLSNIEDNPNTVFATVPPVISSHPETRTNVPHEPDTAQVAIIIKPAPLDIPRSCSVKLVTVSELLDSFEIDKKGLSDDSLDNASDLKDSVSESVLALSEILSGQVFTESIADVVLSEILNQKKIFAQAPMENARKEEINKDFDDITALLKEGKPQSDILPIPKHAVTLETPTSASNGSSTLSTQNLIAQALAHVQAEDKEADIPNESNSPFFSLINSQTEFKDISSQDILLREDLAPFSKKTLATLLSIPISLETQSNQGVYKSYGYSQLEFKPRLDLYFGKNVGLGTTYDLSVLQFPYDSIHINDGIENKFRLDSRIEATAGFVVTIEGGISTKNYDHPLKYYVPIKGKPDKLETTSVNYSHYFLGAGLVFFPLNGLTFTVAGTTTRSSTLRPYLIDSTLRGLTGRSRIGGTQNDDEYSYNLSRGSIFMLWQIFWDLKFSLDLSYEYRNYTNQQLARVATKINSRPTPITVKRDDYGPQFGFDLSKEFLFDSRLISIFYSFTPVVDIQSSNYTSSVKLFSYRDVTTTLSFEFGF